MTMINVPKFSLIAFNRTPGSTTIDTQACTASNMKAAAIFCLAAGSTVSALGFVPSAVTGAPNCQISLQTLNASRSPSGTILGSGACKTGAFLGSSLTVGQFNWFNLGTPYTPAGDGEFVAAVFEYVGTGQDFASGTHQVTVRLGMTPATTVNGQPFTGKRSNVSVWTQQTNVPLIAARNGSGDLVGTGLNVQNITNLQFSTASNLPKAKGNKWTVAAKCRMSGVVVPNFRQGSGGNFSVQVLVNDSLVSNFDISESSAIAAIAANYALEFPMSPVVLEVGDVVEVYIIANTGTQNTSWGYVSFASSAERLKFTGGCDIHAREWDALAEPPTKTDYTDRVYAIYPQINGIELAAAGGGGGGRIGLGL